MSAEPDTNATPACNAEAIQMNDVDDSNLTLSNLNISTQESVKNCYEQLMKSPNSSTIAGTYTYCTLIKYTHHITSQRT